MRRGSKQTQLLYIDIGLSNGAKWRIIYRTKEVYEINEYAGRPEVLGPISIEEFLSQLEEKRDE